MKVIKEYSFRDLKRIEYDGNDAELLKRRFPQSLKPETIDQLCKWLIENNEVIDADDCYDGASGWQGVNFMVRNANLSINGYCLRDDQVLKFIAGENNPRWY